jgi:hypothetical protein
MVRNVAPKLIAALSVPPIFDFDTALAAGHDRAADPG